MSILATVLQKNSFTYAGVGAKSLPIPCGAPQDLHGQYWATPVKTNGVFLGWEFTIANSAPSYDSFQALKLKDKDNGDTFWILGTEAQLRASCADNGTTPMPLASTIPVMIIEEPSCIKNGANYQWEWTADALGGLEVRVYAAVNGVKVTSGQSEAAGFASIAAAVTWLNANAASAGTWSNPAGNTLRLVRATEATVGVTFTIGNWTP